MKNKLLLLVLFGLASICASAPKTEDRLTAFEREMNAVMDKYYEITDAKVTIIWEDEVTDPMIYEWVWTTE